MIGTGASGEILLTTPYRNSSSMMSPMQRILVEAKRSIRVVRRDIFLIEVEEDGLKRGVVLRS
jgi:hypothetical protein